MIKKLGTKWFVLIIWSLIFVVFLVLFLVLISHKETAFWITLGFNIISFVLTLLLIIKGINTKKLLFEYPIYLVSGVYYLVQLVVSIILSLLNVEKFIIVFAIEIILVIAYLVLTLVVFASNRVVEKQDEIIKEKISDKNELLEMIIDIRNNISDDEAIKALDNLYEAIKYSDPITTTKSKDLDNNINLNVSELKSVSSTEEIKAKSKEIKNLITKRNTAIKNNK